MPTYEIRAPNGKTYRIEGPAGASDEQVRAQVLAQHPDAGGGPDASQAVEQAGQAMAGLFGAPRQNAPGAALGGQVVENTRRVAQQNRPLVPEQYSRGLAQGTGSMVKGFVNNTIGLVGNPVGQALYNATGYGDQTYDMGEIARNAAGLPENQSAFGDAAIGLGTGAVGMGGLFGTLANSAKAGGTTQNVMRMMAGNPVVNAIGGASAGGAGQFASDSGAGPWGQLAAALSAGVVGGGIANAAMPGPSIAAAPRFPVQTRNPVIAAGDRWGVPVYTTDIRPPQTFMGKAARTGGERIPLAGTGGMRARQNTARQDAIGRLGQFYGANANATDDVMRNLQATRGDRLSALTRQRDAALGMVDNAVDTPNALAAIDREITRLQGVGTRDANTVIGRLQDWRQAIQNKDINAVNSIREEMGSAFADPNLGSIRTHGEKSLSSIYGPLRTDMGNAIEQAGGQQARASWQSANDQLRAMAGDLGARNFKGVLREADATPEGVERLLFSRRGSDVNRLYDNLGDAGRKQGQAAIIQRAMTEATDNAGNVSPEKFLNALRKSEASIAGFFRDGDRETMRGFRRLISATSRASQSGVETPTGQQMVPLGVTALYGWLSSAIGFLPATGIVGGTGLAARAYESQAMRNAIAGVARTRPGTAQEASAISRVVTLGIQQNAQQRLPNAMNDMVGIPAAAGNREEDQREQQSPLGW